MTLSSGYILLKYFYLPGQLPRTNKNKENKDGNSPTELSNLKNLLQENFKKLNEKMKAVENELKENHQEFLNMLKDVDNKA